MFRPFQKRPHRRGTQHHFEGWSICVLSSRLDPIGEQSDIHYFFSICVDIFCVLGEGLREETLEGRKGLAVMEPVVLEEEVGNFFAVCNC